MLPGCSTPRFLRTFLLEPAECGVARRVMGQLGLRRMRSAIFCRALKGHRAPVLTRCYDRWLQEEFSPMPRGCRMRARQCFTEEWQGYWMAAESLAVMFTPSPPRGLRTIQRPGRILPLLLLQMVKGSGLTPRALISPRLWKILTTLL